MTSPVPKAIGAHLGARFFYSKNPLKSFLPHLKSIAVPSVLPSILAEGLTRRPQLGAGVFFGPVDEFAETSAFAPEKPKEARGTGRFGFRTEECFHSPAQVGTFPRPQPMAACHFPVVTEQSQHFQVRLRAELGGCQKQSCKTGRTRSTCVSPVIETSYLALTDKSSSAYQVPYLAVCRIFSCENTTSTSGGTPIPPNALPSLLR